MGTAAPATGKRGIEKTCGCYQRKRRPPIMVFADVAARILDAMGPAAAAALGHQAIADYRCPECKQFVVITVADFLGASP